MNDRASATGLLKTLTPLGSVGAPPRRRSWLLLVVVTLATLWAGLDPKGYRFRNEVEWLDGRPGLRFGKFGRVHTAPFLDAGTATRLNRGGFTLALAIDPAPDPQGGFRIIACFHAGDDASQLVIGQWRDFIIVMNGDDYDNTRRLPRVTADTSLFEERPLVLAIASTPAGAGLFLNGERVATNAKLHLSLPVEPAPGRLVLGNSVNASQPWMGEISRLELLATPLSAPEIRAAYQDWRTNTSARSDSTGRPLLRYRFAEGAGKAIRSEGSWGEPLIVPSRQHALGARALAWSAPKGVSQRALALDIVLNFIGFVPFGFAVALVLQSTSRSTRRIILLSILAGLGLSLVIELTQAWLPSRDSSLRDLLLNTVGAPIGAFVAVRVGKRFNF